MDRLFLDTNILISAVLRPNSRLARLWEIPQIEIITSTYAIEEALRNLPQQEQLNRLERLLSDLQVVSAWEHISLPASIELPDKDVPIMQAAIAAEASHLLTGDVGDFGSYYGQTIAGVQVLQPAVYLQHITN